MPRLSFTALANPRRGNASLVACVLLAASVIAVELINPNLLPHPKATTAYRPYGDGGRQVLADKVLAEKALANTRVYAAEVVRIIDGDTFVARMRTGPAGEIETRVRLRSIDAAELHARCSKELRLALAARAALQRLLAEGRVTLSHVGPDKYPGRIDANVTTRNNVDVSAAMLNGGWARAYEAGGAALGADEVICCLSCSANVEHPVNADAR
jgi:endonuclease YncB( thermonuclease family)